MVETQQQPCFVAHTLVVARVMFRHIAKSHARLFQAAAASAVAASVGASASCEVHKVHEEHSLVDVRKRLPTEPHFLHGLAWADGVRLGLTEWYSCWNCSDPVIRRFTASLCVVV